MRGERVGSTTARRAAPALSLSAWRGRSGRRYVVGVHDVVEPDLDIAASVVIAVRRDEAGIALPVSVACSDESPRNRLGPWLASVRRRGATEMHVHRLAETPDERHAIVADLAMEPEGRC